jgi:hypothetical protein
MVAATKSHENAFEDVLAKLTAAAYDVTLKYRATPEASEPERLSFLDVELALWTALRVVLESKTAQPETR